MKNNISKFLVGLSLCLVFLFVTSCELFTTSMLTFTKRDLKDSMNKMPTESLVASGKDPTVVGNQDSAIAALEVLGDRTDELEKLSPEEIEKIINEKLYHDDSFLLQQEFCHCRRKPAGD